jgi:hypothetical protein
MSVNDNVTSVRIFLKLSDSAEPPTPTMAMAMKVVSVKDAFARRSKLQSSDLI